MRGSSDNPMVVGILCSVSCLWFEPHLLPPTIYLSQKMENSESEYFYGVLMIFQTGCGVGKGHAQA